MTHAAYEITVGGGDTPLPRRQDAHVAAKAGPAGGGGDDAPRVQEDVRIPQVHTLPVHALGGGDDDAPDAGGQTAAL